MLKAHWCFESWPGPQPWACLVHTRTPALVSACFDANPAACFHYFRFPPVSAGPHYILGNTHQLQHVCLSFHVTTFWRHSGALLCLPYMLVFTGMFLVEVFYGNTSLLRLPPAYIATCKSVQLKSIFRINLTCTSFYSSCRGLWWHPLIPLLEREALFYTIVLQSGTPQWVLARTQFSGKYFGQLQWWWWVVSEEKP